jgi:glucans biosynthesis protein
MSIAMHIRFSRQTTCLVRYVTSIAVISLSAAFFGVTCCAEDSVNEAKALAYRDVRDFDGLCEYSRSAADRAWKPLPKLPKSLASWSYDDYIKVQFRPERATWFDQGLPFWLESFHRGFVQTDRVELFTLCPTNGADPVAQRITFSKDDFHYDESLDAESIPSVGHAGVKIVGRFPESGHAEEVSSYFRSRSRDCVYGASARGLAINIAMNQVEEFPDFRAFWIQLPSAKDDQLVILAHLDSESVSGAYQFRLKPGDTLTRIHVQAQLFFRGTPEKIGVAPMTSMWIWGDGLKGPPKDQRPAVHDSDGLLIRSGEQDWLWRAFARQDYPSVASFDVDRLCGFGMIQRNRAFYHYDDHNARYDKRPSVWVTPDIPWENGTIELLELPGAHEGIDNLACYWRPNELPDVGVPVELSYTLDFFAGDPSDHNVLGRATNLSVNRDSSDGVIAMEVRFAGTALRVLPADAAIEIKANAGRGEIQSRELTKTDTGDWLLSVHVRPEGKEPVELEWQLFSDEHAVSEQFRYLLPPKEPEFTYPAVYTRQE